MVAAKKQARSRRAPLAKALGIALALIWIGVLVWLGIVLVRLKAAGPEALRVPDQTNEAQSQPAGIEQDTAPRED